MMKTFELFETKRQMGKYQIPYSWPNRSHRGLERLYNFVWPELAKALLLPPRNLKLNCWSSEQGSFIIKVSNPKTEIDMLELMAPKALKGLLEKCGFQDVTTEFVGTVAGKSTPKGMQFPLVEVSFKTKYPELWNKYDDERRRQVITFKEFIEEGYFTDTRAKLMALKQDVAKALDIHRYKVVAEAPRIPRHLAVAKSQGQHVRIYVYVTEKDEDHQEIYERAVKLQVEKALARHFGKYELLHVGNESFNGPTSGRAIFVSALIADEEGLL
jgi:hypothetical protein